MATRDQSGFWPRWGENRTFTVLVGILLAYCVILLAFFIKNEALKSASIGKAPEERRLITVNGTGKEIGTPDIATVDLGFTTQSSDVQTALRQNNDKSNKLIAALKAVGIPAADLQTSNFSVYPNYDYNRSPNVIVSYTAQQSISVKVRDLSKVNDVLKSAGDVGANQVSNLNFTIDDPKSLQNTAREEAIADAKTQAATLEQQLGVHFGRLVNFSESGSAPTPLPYQYLKTDAYGLGGGTPSVETGSLDIVSNVSLTYEIE